MNIQVIHSQECLLICLFPEDVSVEMTLSFPTNYPLEPVSFHPGKRIGVSNNVWQCVEIPEFYFLHLIPIYLIPFYLGETIQFKSLME